MAHIPAKFLPSLDVVFLEICQFHKFLVEK